MNSEPAEDRICLLCAEQQLPNGITRNGRFFCQTCDREWILEKRKIARIGKNILSSKEKTEFLLDNLSIFNSSMGLDELMQRFAELISVRLKRDKIAIFVTNLELGEIKLAYYSSRQKTLQRAIKRITLDYDLSYGILVETMAKGEPRFYKFADQSHPFYDFYSKLTGTKSQLVIPILYANTAVGMLTIDYDEEDYSDYFEDQEILQLVVGQFAVSLRNSLIFSKSENQSKNFRSLHTAALTLSQLYLNNHDEMIRMILLTLSGIVESSLTCLIERTSESSKAKIFRLYRDLENYQINTNTTMIEVELIDPLLQIKETITIDPSTSAYVESLGIEGKESMLFPLTLENGTNCVFILTKQESRFPNDEIEALNAFVSLARITMENANLYQNLSNKERLEKEIEIAKEIQSTLLPRNSPEAEGFSFGGFMVPARGIGGDYYDFILSPNRNELFICIGDVSGKGVAAGLVMATVRTILHSLVRVKDSPWEILNDINNYLYASYKEAMTPRFMSMILLRWNLITGEVQYSGAGHGNFYHYHADSKSLSVIETEGVILGIQPDISAFRNESKLRFDSGDTILLYTDGVTEARNADGIEFGESELKSNFFSFISLEPKNILEKIYSELKEFVKEQEQHDDITMVAVRKI
ncbi:SpoIIE family protein phosphatase [Leptospira sp. 2 VSF19]|uniref:SpoIIE family protein phosphatase n=1 Tax=Leptospira soteropolitanensis TaxID=2950025 RepID=A0AAW5VFQ2_9LEPT|nr:GAF domain-containing SpoIIE family protein phosphatase [Leptospira soteropolitanensis]MCW7494035.1 SpoIIE family protein phosphatase [Leptospira soteropolitanensis]MCW7501699.1 SpoIIE family protein phosphatase [Leptospira soteropolitanensis]MCW7523881.1 SpoIIE family protein phosphatase [Leptospira soteropolitanensis]MCW7527746.1 SpoIIE family protein phosphatase [Leptospira soteropolitanensis]MCW7531669.1 SpoIIE family protein phosphatase [Leptospira soteropolitanensis]